MPTLSVVRLTEIIQKLQTNYYERKWSIQLLHDEKVQGSNGETKEMRVLTVCTEGIELYKKAFVEDKYKDCGRVQYVPYEMIVLAGKPCPEGKFYAVDYLVGNCGMYHHLLIQAVKPEDDIQLILGKLASIGMIDADYNPHKARLLEYIEAVRIGTCFEDKEGPLFHGNHKEAKQNEEGILDFSLKNPSTGTCIEIYSERGLVEEWIDGNDKFDSKPVFVCGGKNVWDEAFQDMREEDLDELRDHIDSAVQLAMDYNMHHIIRVGIPHSDINKVEIIGGASCNEEFAQFVMRNIGVSTLTEETIEGLLEVSNLLYQDKKDEAMEKLDEVVKATGIENPLKTS